MKPLIILRPEPGASETLARAKDRGLTALKLPLFQVEAMAWSLPALESLDALLVTSANAVRRAGPQLDQLRHFPAFAVGEATAAALRDRGFAVAVVGSAGVDALLQEIDPSLRLLHLCGEDRHFPVNSRRELTSLPVYRSVALKGIATKQLHGAVALVHSARAGIRLAEIATDRRSVSIAAISDGAAAACGSGWSRLAVAATPRDEALLSLAERLCKGLDPE